MLLHDLALLQLHVVLGVDRAGLVGEDGRTHHGMFDVGYLRQVPGMKIYCPASFAELRRMLRQAVLEDKGPGRCALSERRRGKLSDGQGAVAFKRGQRLHCDHLWYDNQRRSRSGGRLRKRGNFRRGFEACDDCTAGFCSDRGILPQDRRVLVVEETSNHGCVADELFARLLQSGVMGHFCKQNLGDGYICHARGKIYMRWRG